MDKVITYTAVAIVIIIVITAIYIGRTLYKARMRKDLESSGGIQKLERVLELKPLPYEKKEVSHEKDSQFSLGNSSITLSQDKEKKSSPNNSKRSAKSINKSKNGSLNGSRYGSRSDSSVNSSLIIKIPKIKDAPPPPPPSPLKPPDGSIDSFLNIIPSDISESTQTAVMSSNASSPILSSTQLKSDLKAYSQPIYHGNYELA